MNKLIKPIIIFLLIPLSLVLIVVLQVGFIFILFALIPSLIAYFADGYEGKPTFKCVFFCNLSGIIPTIAHAINADSAAIAMQSLMADSYSWILAIGSAFGGWGLLLFSRVLTQIALSISDQARIEIFQKKQEELIKEWGEMIKPRH